MKSVFVVLAALAATAVAQLPNAPKCADPCLAPILTNGVEGCESDDFKCICENQSFIEDIGQCLLKECNAAEMKATIDAAYALCSAVGVDLPTTVPTLAATSSGATGTITSAPSVTPTGTSSNTTTNGTITTAPTTSSTGAAATNYVANGLGVAGAAVAAFLFL